MTEPQATPVDPASLGSLAEVTLEVAIEIGRRRMTLREVLELDQGGLLTLDRSIEEPVALVVNDRPTARGELVVVNGRLGLRITELLA
jgi:flagellar motor switch protein FliN/FliY